MRGLSIASAFHLFDSLHNGLLTPADLWGGLQFLGLTTLQAADVLGLVSVLDSDRDGQNSAVERKMHDG